LLDQGAEVIGVDLSARMVDAAADRCGPRARFVVADLAEPLPVPRGSLDGITSSLTLHYLRDWSTPLASFATALRHGGWVVLSLDHPFAPPLTGQHGGYFDTELVTDTWSKGGVDVTQRFWRRPLGATVEAFADAGFAVERIVEARPGPRALARWPDTLGALIDVPIFIVYRLRRT
jgi:SAM-dependent methyltransferase